MPTIPIGSISTWGRPLRGSRSPPAYELRLSAPVLVAFIELNAEWAGAVIARSLSRIDTRVGRYDRGGSGEPYDRGFL